MPADYAALSPIYNQIGMADFAETITPRLINYVQRSDWLGRRILDMGCGTGTSMQWLARHSYITSGVDNAPQMLEQARARLTQAGLNFTLYERDIRELGNDFGTLDMVLALDVLPEINSLRELEAAFQCAHTVLAEGKLLIFDMYTIQGLTERGQHPEGIVYDDQGLTVFSQNNYDYERQVEERRYMIFQQNGEHWTRSAATRTLRAYPAQAIAALLQRCGFAPPTLVNTDFQPYEPGVSAANRIFFIAEKR